MDFKVSYLDQGLASSYSEFGGETAAPSSGKNINPRWVPVFYFWFSDLRLFFPDVIKLS